MTRGIERTDWPFKTMLPYLVVFYPMPQVGEEIGAQPQSAWPLSMDWKLRRWIGESDESIENNQIYIHVPFCPFICDYCHFYKVTDSRDRTAKKQEEYTKAVISEIEMYGRSSSVNDKKFNSVYFGGGTPTQLRADQICRIIDAIKLNFTLREDAEITVEGVAQQMLKRGFLKAIFAAGVNRLSYGVQSMEDDVRGIVGRTGEKLESYRAAHDKAKEINPNVRVNVDMMAGLPNQSTESILADIRQISSWGMNSIDVNWFVMIPGTPLYKKILNGDAESNAYGEKMLEMRKSVQRVMEQEGFQQLTGEAFSRNDKHQFSRNFNAGNSKAMNTVIGLGPSAQGSINGNVYRNITDLNKYLGGVLENQYPVNNVYRLNSVSARRRAILYALMQLSVPKHLINKKAEQKKFNQWADKGLIEETATDYVLTREGRLWYNNMQFEFLTLADLKDMVPMMGSASDRRKLLSKDNGFSEEFKRLIKNSDGLVKGRLSYMLYRTVIFLQEYLPFLDGRAIGWGGRINDSSDQLRKTNG